MISIPQKVEVIVEQSLRKSKKSFESGYDKPHPTPGEPFQIHKGLVDGNAEPHGHDGQVGSLQSE